MASKQSRVGDCSHANLPAAFPFADFFLGASPPTIAKLADVVASFFTPMLRKYTNVWLRSHSMTVRGRLVKDGLTGSSLRARDKCLEQPRRRAIRCLHPGSAADVRAAHGPQSLRFFDRLSDFAEGCFRFCYQHPLDRRTALMTLKIGQYVRHSKYCGRNHPGRRRHD